MPQPKASILIVSMIILGIIIIAGLNLALVSVKEMNMSAGSARSSQAYQIADEGVEVAMQKLLDADKSAIISSLFVDSGCSNGVISNATEKGIYEITFFKKDGSEQEILADCDTTTVGEITSIKSSGSTGEEKRNIKIPVYN